MNATTLNGAIGVSDNQIRLTSGTGAAVGSLIKVDDEKMRILNIDLTPVVSVSRGINGTAAAAHATLATVDIGTPDEFAQIPAPGQYTYGAAGALQVKPGVHVLKSGAASAMTLRAPTGAENGIELEVVAATAHAYTVTQTTPGFNNAGTSGDVGTFGGAIGDNFRIRAINGQWHVMTATNVTVA